LSAENMQKLFRLRREIVQNVMIQDAGKEIHFGDICDKVTAKGQESNEDPDGKIVANIDECDDQFSQDLRRFLTKCAPD